MKGALVLAALTFALPPACAKIMAKKGLAGSDTASADTAPPPPPPPPAPPVWAPPATAQPVDTSTSPSASASAAVPASGPEFVKARAAAETKDWKKVKALLDKRVKGGKASPDEAQLLVDACRATKDKACVDAVTAKYPALGSRGLDTP